MENENNTEGQKLFHSVCEVNIDGKMSLLSFYDDLPHFEYDMTIDNLKSSNTQLKKLAVELKQQIQKLEKENLHLKNTNVILSKNIASLYKTACGEITRKDKLIDELRNNQVNESQSTSNILKSSNNLQLEGKETLFNKSSNKQHDTQKIISPKNNSETLNGNDYDNITNIVIQPNHDIPKTIYYKRLCEKLIKQNETISYKNKTSKCLENSNTEIIQDKHECFNNNNNDILKGTASNKVYHNDSLNHLNSTLVICESDVTASECELDTTPVINFQNSEKSENDISLESFSPEIKQPSNLNKNMDLNPATINIPNLSNDTFKCVEKLKENQNLDLKIMNEVSDSPETKVIKYPNKDEKSTIMKKHCIKYSSEKNDKIPSETNEIHNKNVLILNKTNQIPSINIEVEQIPCKKKKIVTERNNTTIKVSKVIKSSRVSCLSSSDDNNCNISTKDVKSLPDNNEIELSSAPKQGNNQLELPVNHCVDSFKKCSQLKNTVESSSTSTAVETSLGDKINIPSINIEVEQIPCKKKKIVTERNNTTIKVSKVIKSSRVSCLSSSDDNNCNISTKDVKSLPDNNKKELASSPKQGNNQLELPVNHCVVSFKKCPQLKNTVESSSTSTAVETSLSDKINTPCINIEVDQVPIRRKHVVILRDNTFEENINKSLHVTCSNSSTDSEPNMVTKNVKHSSMNKKKESSSPIVQNINHFDSKFPDNNHINSLKKCIKLNNTVISLPKKTVFETNLADKINTPSINIEVEQVPTRRKRIIIQKNNFEATNVRKSFHMPCSNLSSDNEFNTSTKNVKCLFMNHKEKSSISLTENNNQLKHKLPLDKNVGDLNKFTRSNDPNKNSTENTVIEPCFFNYTDVPSISIEVEQGSMFRHSDTRKVIMHSSLSDDKQELKKGRRVELITIKKHYSQPLPSFNGAKKTEIDVSKNKAHIEKVVESSSRFYVPQVKRRRPMNFSNADF